MERYAPVAKDLASRDVVNFIIAMEGKEDGRYIVRRGLACTTEENLKVVIIPSTAQPIRIESSSLNLGEKLNIV